MAADRTTKDVVDESRKAMADGESQRRLLRNIYADEEKVPMYLSPMYRAHFGNVMQVRINGVGIYFPVDGTTHNVPRTFADEITRRRMSVDNILSKQDQMSSVADNAERTPGELSVF